jgi:hypothetical protein
MEEGLIRKIIIGRDPKDSMAYYIGMKAGKGNVCAILDDERHFSKYGLKRYLVYIKEGDDTMLWKSIDSMPCMIEFDLNF